MSIAYTIAIRSGGSNGFVIMKGNGGIKVSFPLRLGHGSVSSPLCK